MKTFSLILENPVASRFQEGGSFMMALILICFLVSLFFIVKSVLNLKKEDKLFLKSVNLIAEVSLLGLVIGVFASIIGLITAFDAIEAAENVTNTAFAAGIKTSFLTVLFGAVTFIIARIAIIILKILKQ